MDKGKIEAMATKFSEKFAISMLKKHRKFCRCGLTHLDATPIVQIYMRHPVVAIVFCKTPISNLPHKIIKFCDIIHGKCPIFAVNSYFVVFDNLLLL